MNAAVATGGTGLLTEDGNLKAKPDVHFRPLDLNRLKYLCGKLFNRSSPF